MSIDIFLYLCPFGAALPEAHTQLHRSIVLLRPASRGKQKMKRAPVSSSFLRVLFISAIMTWLVTGDSLLTWRTTKRWPRSVTGFFTGDCRTCWHSTASRNASPSLSLPISLFQDLNISLCLSLSLFLIVVSPPFRASAARLFSLAFISLSLSAR